MPPVVPVLLLPEASARLRPFGPADAPALARHANDRLVWQNLGDRIPHPYALTDAKQYLATLAAAPAGSDLHWCLEVAGEAVGSISLRFKTDVRRRSAEIGYWVGRAHWGRGLATAAVQAITAYGLANFDLVRLYALVFAHNPASGRVLEKAGFVLEARLKQAITKDGHTLDGLLYALVR
ncbi:GNAT family N-acetyltransferase [Hymenobacter sp. IS2118]|uniref:GNAT family N-acetyltransferase n=1 Tax=Hymenobacter sp. IS2118 TaxID=1505605 RepID=UPI000AC7CF37|nr:GNAT family N-acetyltransferase [Hymenobacter sp. IS2118]